MKKSILISGLLVLGGIFSSFANNTNGVNKNVSNSFQRDFGYASQVKWESTKNFDKATFVMDGQTMFAYYSQSGDLIAVTQNILSSQLPVSQLKSLKKNYKGYWITDLFEVNLDSDTYYYITIENADFKIVLKSKNACGWELYSKEEKI
ncbi:MAG TPA: hypothetical protein VGZ71_01520 [Puia sp.]|jgi:hypothetical protein|nr:hypothetical protein [Puia sp.]